MALTPDDFRDRSPRGKISVYIGEGAASKLDDLKILLGTSNTSRIVALLIEREWETQRQEGKL